jgi:hypothetical protein
MPLHLKKVVRKVQQLGKSTSLDPNIRVDHAWLEVSAVIKTSTISFNKIITIGITQLRLWEPFAKHYLKKNNNLFLF